MLVIQPIGGKDDWEALFHEAGHTEHYANTSADLPTEDRRLGDMAVTEGWAALLEKLVTEPEWLNRRLDVPRPEALAREGAVSALFFVRRYSAKLLYEIEFFQADDPATMQERYFELLSDALKFPVNRQSYLDDIDGSYYVIGYLRSWAFEAQLRDYLRETFGSDWFARREAGGLLRELWSLGQGPTADALLKDVSGATARDGLGRRSDPRGARRLTTPFEELVRQALDELPPHLAAALGNVAVVVREADPDEPDLLGLYEEHEYLPAQVTVFRRPLVEAFPDRQELEEQIRITVLHELGHHFGLDEDRLDELGYS